MMMAGMLWPDTIRKDRPHAIPHSHRGSDDLRGRCLSLDCSDSCCVTRLVCRWCCHGMRGRLKAASIIKLIALWRIVQRGNAGKKFSNRGADNQFSLIKSGYFAGFGLRTLTSTSSTFYIHAVKYICQGTNAHFVIYLIFPLLLLPDRLSCGG